MIDIFLLVAAFLVILVGAELFTNGIEWVGHRLNLAEGAVGSVLAAVGTALPETMIPLVALVLGGHGADTDAIGIGAILGAPFMLATLALFVTGAAVLQAARRRRLGPVLDLDAIVLSKDVRFFALSYMLAIAVAFVPVAWWPVRPAAAIVLVLLYVIYVRAHLRGEPTEIDRRNVGPLRLHRLDQPGHRADPQTPRLRVIYLQVFIALACIMVGALVFVRAVEDLSLALGVAPIFLALVVAPIATELPEKANSVIWVRQSKDTLALGNITGAMVFQACIPTVIALLLAPEAWSVSDSGLPFASAVIAFLSTAVVFLPLARGGVLTGRRMLWGGVFYVAYILLVGSKVAGLW
ncbi:MAG: sodium:calcium antiporter [Candidatus Limnocylindrales bacterium]